MLTNFKRLALQTVKYLDPKTVVIIGAGPAGLISAHEALQHDLKPLVFESSNSIGGIWQHGTWPEMQTNLSKFSLFSALEDNLTLPMFPSAKEINNYLHTFAVKHKLYEHILFNAKVTSLQMAREKLKTLSVLIDGNSHTIYAHNVIVASGFFNSAAVPNIPDLPKFKNPPIHSSSYKDHDLTDKDVVVIGNGFSGVDIATKTTQSAASVTHIIRNPYWILPRFMPLPLDLQMASYKRFGRQTQSEVILKTAADYQKANAYLAQFCPDQLNKQHPLYINPASTKPPFVAISDHYLQLIDKNEIRIQIGNVASFTNKGLYLQDGTKFVAADNVIFCTGYNVELPFLSPHILKTLQFNSTDPFQPLILHKGMLHPDLPGLAFVGMYRGPYFTIMELMARVVCGIFAGKIKIAPETMQQGLIEAAQIRAQTPRPQFPHGDFVGFANDLAQTCGWDLNEIQRTKHTLYKVLMNKPVTAADFRIFDEPNIFLQQFSNMQECMQAVGSHNTVFDKPQAPPKVKF